MKTATRVALILAGPALLLGVGLYRDSLQHRMPPPAPPVALVVPEPLPECWRQDMEAAELRLWAASARLNGHGAEAAMWQAEAERVAGLPCKGERWEAEQ